MDKNKIQPTKNTNKNTSGNFMKEEFGDELDTGTIKKNTMPGFKSNQQIKNTIDENKKTT